MLDKNDKRFISALAFAQTGIIFFTISFFGFFWFKHTIATQTLNQAREMNQLMKYNMESNLKINTLKEQLKKEGIGVVEETP